MRSCLGSLFLGQCLVAITENYSEVFQFFYRRHCAVANMLENTNHDWYVFIDSDMEIVNPYR